ncbi:hypothetical protein, partial [Hungatella hathewayi]
KTSSRSTQTRQKDDTKFVILNATFNIFKVNATGSVYRGCIYFENLLSGYTGRKLQKGTCNRQSFMIKY